MGERTQGNLEFWSKLLSPILAIVTFAWGIYTYGDTARQTLAQAEVETQRLAETRRIEATRPYLDRQLVLYTEATTVTATIATSTDPKEIAKATKRFKELYWGELSMVEHGQVEGAMVGFSRALEATADRSVLEQKSLALAHACRDELAASWGTDAWRR
jgi:hypothetical protein